jgi:hypothetical protein
MVPFETSISQQVADRIEVFERGLLIDALRRARPQSLAGGDDLAMQPVADPISIPDVHATIHAALGANPAEVLYDGARPVPVTDGGIPIVKLF